MPRRNPVRRGRKELEWDEYDIEPPSGRKLHALLVEVGVVDDEPWSRLTPSEQRSLEQASELLKDDTSVELHDRSLDEEEEEQVKFGVEADNLRSFELGTERKALAKTWLPKLDVKDSPQSVFVIGEVYDTGVINWNAMVGIQERSDEGELVLLENDDTFTDDYSHRPSEALKALARRLKNIVRG